MMDFIFWGVVVLYLYISWQEHLIASHQRRVENVNNLEMETIK